MSDGRLDPRLTRKSEPAGFEPALGGPGRDLLARHAGVLARLPAAMTADLPPERVLWNLWLGALNGDLPWAAEAEAALACSSEFVRTHLPDDLLAAVAGPLRECWPANDLRPSALGPLVKLLHGCPDDHPQCGAVHRLLGELAALPVPAVIHARSRLPAALSAIRLRKTGADDGSLLRWALEACPVFVPLLLEPDRADDGLSREWDVSAALVGGPGRRSLGDIAAVLERWYRNCPPGSPADAGVRALFGMLGTLPIVPGLPLLRIALERLLSARRWRSGFYDASRPLVQAVRNAVWIDRESPGTIREFLHGVLACPHKPSARARLIRLALSNPLFSGHVEAVLGMEGLADIAAAAFAIERRSGLDGEQAVLADLLPPAILLRRGFSPTAGRADPHCADRGRRDPRGICRLSAARCGRTAPFAADSLIGGTLLRSVANRG